MYKLGVSIALALTLGGCALFRPSPPQVMQRQAVARSVAVTPIKPVIVAPARVEASPAPVAPTPKISFRQRVLNSLVRQRQVGGK